MKPLKFIYLLTTATLAALLFPACGEVHCPAFPEELKAYYPYHVGDVLRFANTAEDTIEFVVESVYATKSYTYKKNCDCECDPVNFHFEANSKLYFPFGIMGKISYFNEASVDLFCDFFSSDDMPKEGYKTERFTAKDTLLLQPEWTTRMGRVLVVKGKGIFSFYDKERDCTWEKVD